VFKGTTEALLFHVKHCAPISRFFSWAQAAVEEIRLPVFRRKQRADRSSRTLAATMRKQPVPM
jgi:hypothetical protein